MDKSSKFCRNCDSLWVLPDEDDDGKAQEKKMLKSEQRFELSFGTAWKSFPMLAGEPPEVLGFGGSTFGASNQAGDASSERKEGFVFPNELGDKRALREKRNNGMGSTD